MVVADVLGGYAKAIRDVEHEGGKAMAGWDGGGVNVQLCACVVSKDDLFAPVAKDVG